MLHDDGVQAGILRLDFEPLCCLNCFSSLVAFGSARISTGSPASAEEEAEEEAKRVATLAATAEGRCVGKGIGNGHARKEVDHRRSRRRWVRYFPRLRVPSLQSRDSRLEPFRHHIIDPPFGCLRLIRRVSMYL